MAKFVNPKRTVKVRLQDGDEQYVEIKAKLSNGEVNQINGVMMEAQQKVGEEFIVRARFKEYTEEMLRMAVVDWHLIDEDGVFVEAGEPLPFKLEYLFCFDPEEPILDKVYQEIEARNPSLSARSQSGSENTPTT